MPNTFYLSRLIYCGLIGLAASCNKSLTSSPSVDRRPNIVIIMADDLGFSDLGCYGGEILTPNLDSIAHRGLRFTQFYNAGRCCPTRASLLTGLYPHQAGIGRMTTDTGKPGYRGFLTPNTVTIAEALRGAGYQTGMVGKWHVSQTRERSSEEQLKWLSHQQQFGQFSDTAQYPTARGFDRFFGNIWGVVDYFDPFSLVNGTSEVSEVPSNYYHTDAISDTAVGYLEKFAQQDKPFFLYVAHTAPHWPLHAFEEDISKYERVYQKGWEQIRQDRYQRMLQLGLFDSASAPLSSWMFPGKSWADDQNAQWDARAMAVHAAMVDRMDQGVGRLVAKLRELNQLNNTLIIFLSDNGASNEDPAQYGPGFDRAGSTRDGRRVSFPLEKSPENMPGPETVHAGIGPQWAHAANTPFRYWKAKTMEGGICTPFLAQWPDVMRTAGTITNKMAHVIDLMPTCMEIAQGVYPSSYHGRQITPQAGSSLLPILTNGTRTDPDAIFWEHFGSKALRQSKWKLVQLSNEHPWELFDLDLDRTEMNNVAQQFPDVLTRMQRKWEEMANANQIYPMPD
jgi:arylsulfatase A-like enzyme